MSTTRTVIIDGIAIDVDPNLALIQACELAGIEIPRFCYHGRLSVAGNCRMCLVEPVGAPKPAASCHLQIRDLRGGPNGEPPEVRTNSPMVKKAREGVMEFLLINHPLDCPICDQGGECDLQDQAMAYGIDASRFKENKRAMDEIHLGPLIKTQMTRCIQCTRCVRFVTEVAGVPEMGCTGRGEDAEIISYLNQALTSELQGNVIDLCPVGALTSRPYAFTARPWELRKTETIDVMDALGANIRVDARGREVLRIQPRENDAINEEWLDDKQRFVWDGLKRQRLDRPYIRDAVSKKLKPASWDEALAAAAAKINAAGAGKTAAIAGDLVPLEAMWALKSLMAKIGSPHLDCRQAGEALPTDNPATWRFNPGVAAIDKADFILIIGGDPRKEAPVLNARIRKAWLNQTDVAVIGPKADLTYAYTHFGATAASLAKPPAELIQKLTSAAHPLIILNAGATARADGAAVLASAMRLAEQTGAITDDWTGFAVLHTAAARVGGLEIGFAPGDEGRSTRAILAGAQSGDIEVVYLLGADEIDPAKLGDAFVIYQGSHGDAGANRADIIFPSACYIEEDGLFLNTEGRPQLAHIAAAAPGEAKSNWAVIRALSGEMGQTLAFDNIDALRAEIFAAVPWIAGAIGALPAAADWRIPSAIDVAWSDVPLASVVTDFYLTNPIARASITMAQLSRAMANRNAEATAQAVVETA
jgi:NADH-quinone oxidoreductase subunit G